ncbi:MAG: hypothetical protein JWQ88_3716 [Rhodoferax sp.]|nr:hypothetical protein [Rhodoferax sp.]
MNALSPYSAQEHPPARATPASLYAQSVGSFLLAAGLWGMASPVVFGVLQTNRLHAAVHIVAGLHGIAAGLGRVTSGYLLFLGTLLLATGTLYFVPWSQALVANLLNVNAPVAGLNILLGLTALLLRAFGRSPHG